MQYLEPFVFLMNGSMWFSGVSSYHQLQVAVYMFAFFLENVHLFNECFKVVMLCGHNISELATGIIYFNCIIQPRQTETIHLGESPGNEDVAPRAPF